MTNKLFDIIHENLGYSHVPSYEIVDAVEEWISQYACDFNDRYAEGYETALKDLKENLK